MLREPGWDCWFVMDDDEERARLIHEYGPRFISSKGFKNKIFCLNAAAWVTSSLETPVGGAFLAIRRLVYHLGHGVPFKNAGLSEKNVLWYKRWYYALVRTNFSYFLAPSEATVPFIQQNFGLNRSQVVIKSQPRLEPLLQAHEREDIPERRSLTVLYAPTWRQSGDVRLFPFADLEISRLQKFLEERGIEIYLRLHPYYENSESLRSFLGSQIRLLSSKEVPEVMDVLAQFDVVVTDYSSLFVDFLILDRPVFFVPYDLAEYEKEVGFIRSYRELTPGPHILTQEAFEQELEALCQGRDSYQQARRQLNQDLNGLTEDPCRENIDFLASKLGRS